MAVVRRNGAWFIYFRPFHDRKIGVKLLNVTGKKEASRIEIAILTACRSGNYSGLDSISRETCIRMFSNQQWELPTQLRPEEQLKEITLWDASRLFLTYPGIRTNANRWRYECALAHVIERLGKDTPIKSIWIPVLKQYQTDRVSEDLAAPATVNRELGTLSRLFGVLIENQLLEVNPVRLVRSLSCKSGLREVYLSFQDVNAIAGRCPEWFRPMIWTAYYTGMRRGELLVVTRRQINLKTRLIFLTPEQTKEGNPKRIPIHKELVPILNDLLKVTVIGNDRVFLIQDHNGIRPVGSESFKNCWPRALASLKMKKPLPRFHDLRHTWRTNARRSGVDAQIAESIIGHWFRGKSVNDRYGRIGNHELIDAIDKMSFDHGDTEILVSAQGNNSSVDRKMVTGW